ncbi:MAG: Calx-beta domain-containing protein [Acidimicrobiales bacterium]
MSRFANSLGVILRKVHLPGKRVLAVIVAFCVVAAGVWIGLAVTGGTSSSTGRTVIYSTVQTRALSNTTVISGTLGHKDFTTIEAQSPGFISAVNAKANTMAKAGDALFALGGRDAIAVDGSLLFFRPLSPGDVGPDVLELKQILKAAGDNPGSMDDVFTQQTQAALADWQAQHHYPSAIPATTEAVTVGLQQGVGYQVGAQSAAGMTIGPPGGGTAAGPATAGGSSGASAAAAAQASAHVNNAAAAPASAHLTSAMPPTVSVTSATTYLTKGEPFTVLIGLSQAVSTQLTVNLAYSGSAAEGVDYIVPPGNVVVPPGQTQIEAQIPTVSSNLVEGDTTLTVSLAASAAYEIGSPSSATVTIHDPNVPQMTISGSTSIQPGESATLTITASQAPVHDTQVVLSFAGSAQAGTDYNLPDPVVTIPAGSTTAQVTIWTLATQTIEPSRYIVVSIAQSTTGAYTVTTPGSAVVTIAGANAGTAPPVLTLTSPITYLHKGGPYQVVLGLSQAIYTPVTVQLAYAGTAVAGKDFNPPAGSITIPPGQTSFEVTIPTIADNVVESDTTLIVRLVPSPEYQMGVPNQTSVTITSSVVPTITVSTSSQSMTEGGDATITFTADQAPDKDISINFSVVGTAQPGQDYVPLAGTVILPEGQTSVTVTFQSIQKDVVFEPTDMIVAIWPVRVGQVYIKQGNAVTAGEPLVDLTVPQESVTLQASPSDLTQLAVGQSCTMTISGGQSTLDGVITELDSNPTNISSSGGSGGGSGGGGGQEVFEGQIEVSGGLSKADQNADGATVSITVTTQEVKNALSVPVAAVLQNGSGQDVVRLVELSHGGEIREVPITTGLTAGSYVQIKGGLHAGQVVLVSINQNQS